MTTPVLFLAYNRPRYTEESLTALLATPGIAVTIFDNGSDPPTKAVLAPFASHPKVQRIIWNGRNVGMNPAVNTFLRANRDAEWVAKMDNDTVVTPEWLDSLLADARLHEMDALSAWHWRPEGPAGTFWEWATCMRESADGRILHHDYCGGTAVVLRMAFFRRYGLLYEKYESMLGDLTLMLRHHYTSTNVGFSKNVFARLLDLQHDNGALSGDYPEYDAQVRLYRDAGNAWYTKMGGVPGIAAWIESRGGREKL